MNHGLQPTASLMALYNQQIKSLAEQARHRLATNPADLPAAGQHSHGALDNPLCGDQVQVQLYVEKGLVVAIEAEVRGCLLCEAGTTLMQQLCVGQPLQSIQARTAALPGFLRSGQALAEPWNDALACFAPLQQHSSRHSCVLLPFETLLSAMDEQVDSAICPPGD